MPRKTKIVERVKHAPLTTFPKDVERKYLHPEDCYTIPVPNDKPVRMVWGSTAPMRDLFMEHRKEELSARKQDLFQLIESVISQTLPRGMDQLFGTFADIKEVPYGRCNTDTDYRGD